MHMDNDDVENLLSGSCLNVSCMVCMFDIIMKKDNKIKHLYEQKKMHEYKSLLDIYSLIVVLCATCYKCIYVNDETGDDICKKRIVLNKFLKYNIDMEVFLCKNMHVTI